VATKEFVVDVCDLCVSEDDVAPHTVRLDRRTALLDACAQCWAELGPAVEAGRRGPAGAPALGRAGPRPATLYWTFKTSPTSHSSASQIASSVEKRIALE